MKLLLWFIFVGGITTMFNTAFVQTENFSSAVVFKVIPFIFGLASVLYGLKSFHII